MFLQKELGLQLIILQAFILEMYICMITIACAMDGTSKFSWLEDGFVLDIKDKRFSNHVNMSWIDD